MPDDGTSAAAWLHAGRVGRPHGLDGSFYVSDPNPSLLRVGAVVRVADGPRAIERHAGVAERPIVRLEGCPDRQSAIALRGQELLVARTAAPELGPDEWWAEDLEGCSVLSRDEPVGFVRRVIGLPSCEVLEVERAGADVLLVPLIGDAVRSVDVRRRRIEIDLVFLGEPGPSSSGGSGCSA